MRGLFSEGVLDVLDEGGVTVDGVVGVSAGALFGCNFLSHQIGRGIRYNIRYKDDPRYMGLRSLLTTGNLVNAEFAYHTVPLQLDVFDDEAFRANPTKFYLVCTDIVTGKPVYHLIESINDTSLEWFRATSAMPVVSRPVTIDGCHFLDGGMVDCIPLRYFQSAGYDRNIVILTQPEGYRKKANHLASLCRIAHPGYPKVAEVMKVRHEVYNSQLDYVAQQEALGKTLVIRPDVSLNIGRTELTEQKMRWVYDCGRAKAREMLDDVRRFLSC